MAPRDERDLRQEFYRRGQEHVFRFWPELAPAQREYLCSALARIDLGVLDHLLTLVRQTPGTGDDPGKVEPAGYVPVPGTDEEKARHRQARQAGENLLAAGKVAAVLVAGGQGTRLGFDRPKGCFPFGPVTGRPLFQIFAEQILASQRRYGPAFDWYVMTSEATHEETTAFFTEHRYWGLCPEQVVFFCQGMLPAFDRQGKILMEEKYLPALGPDGHGGMVSSLRRHGLFERLREKGISYLSYFQVDNPLALVLDPVFLGFTALEHAEVATKVVLKTDPAERVGLLVEREGRPALVEYSDLSPEEQQRQAADGALCYRLGNTAIHAFRREFLEQEGFSFPYHRAEKKIPCVDERGEKVSPADKNAIKFETFIFDLLSRARTALNFEVERREQFSPIKNVAGVDSPVTAVRDYGERAARWLEGAGLAVPRRGDGTLPGAIEVSPLFALEAGDLSAKAGRLRGRMGKWPLVLG